MEELADSYYDEDCKPVPTTRKAAPQSPREKAEDLLRIARRELANQQRRITQAVEDAEEAHEMALVHHAEIRGLETYLAAGEEGHKLYQAQTESGAQQNAEDAPVQRIRRKLDLAVMKDNEE